MVLTQLQTNPAKKKNNKKTPNKPQLFVAVLLLYLKHQPFLKGTTATKYDSLHGHSHQCKAEGNLYWHHGDFRAASADYYISLLLVAVFCCSIPEMYGME